MDDLYGSRILEPTERPAFRPAEKDAYLLSVLIPAYRAEAYIGDAVRSAAMQEIPRANVPEDLGTLQIVVVDDGSPDEGAGRAGEALKAAAAQRDDLAALLVKMPHRGQAAARNTALSYARGRWVLFLDADDLLAKEAVPAFLRGAAEVPEADVICGLCRDFISPELSKEEAAQLKIEPAAYRRKLSGCTLLRRALFDAVGLYDEALASSETAQWMLRLEDSGAVLHDVDAVTLLRRYHRNNFGRLARKTQIESYMEIIRQRVRAQQSADKEGTGKC